MTLNEKQKFLNTFRAKESFFLRESSFLKYLECLHSQTNFVPQQEGETAKLQSNERNTLDEWMNEFWLKRSLTRMTNAISIEHLITS